MYAQTGQYVFRQTTGNSFFITAVSVSASYKIKNGQSFKFTHLGAVGGDPSDAVPVYFAWGNSDVVAIAPDFDGTEQIGDVLSPGVISVITRPVGPNYSGGYIAFVVPDGSASQLIAVTPGEGE